MEQKTQELAKVFRWMKEGVEVDDKKRDIRNKLRKEGKGKGDIEKLFTDKNVNEQIDEALRFLGVEATEEELRAVEEMMGDIGESAFSFDSLEKIFVRTPQEKFKEYEQLLQAFRSLKVEGEEVEEGECIALSDLSKTIQEYQGSYEKSFLMIKDDLRKTAFVKDDMFYYKDYLDELYNIKELKQFKPSKNISAQSPGGSEDDSDSSHH